METTNKQESIKLPVQPEVAADSGETEAAKLWVFVYVNENLEECTRLFRRQESCEKYAVEYLSKVYGYVPKGNLEQDITALEKLWLDNEENDCWYTSECAVLD